LPPDALALRQDLRPVRVLLGRAVAGLFQERHIDQGGGVALRAWIAVPVPGAAEVGAFLDDPHIGHPRFGQPRAGDQPGEPAADEGEGDVVVDGRALGWRERRVEPVSRQGALCSQILRVALGPQAFLALRPILASSADLSMVAMGAP
jgi:hypothetical protein